MSHPRFAFRMRFYRFRTTTKVHSLRTRGTPPRGFLYSCSFLSSSFFPPSPSPLSFLSSSAVSVWYYLLFRCVYVILVIKLHPVFCTPTSFDSPFIYVRPVSCVLFARVVWPRLFGHSTILAKIADKVPTPIFRL